MKKKVDLLAAAINGPGRAQFHLEQRPRKKQRREG
jgi:hypothetical protein